MRVHEEDSQEMDEPVISTDSGLRYVDLVEGRGASLAPGDRVEVHYTGWLEDAGAPEAGRIDEAFDRDFLATLEKGDTEAAVSLPTERIDAAGFGTWEVRQWVMVLGAVPDRKAQVLAYEAVKEWETGCAVVTFE